MHLGEVFHVKHLRSIEEAAGTIRGKPRRSHRPGTIALLLKWSADVLLL